MRKKRDGAFYEPTVWCPGFSRSGPPKGGTPNKFCRNVRFMVPMHGTKVEGAFHEPSATSTPLTQECPISATDPRRPLDDNQRQSYCDDN